MPDIAIALGERARDDHRAGPRAEVLRRDSGAGDLLEIGVHDGRIDRLHDPRIVPVFEELLARQVAAAPDHARDALVVDFVALLLAALAAKSQLDACAAHASVTVAQRGEADR